MNIAFVLLIHNPNELAGIERSVASLADGLRALGHYTVIVAAGPATTADDALAERPAVAPVADIRLPVSGAGPDGAVLAADSAEPCGRLVVGLVGELPVFFGEHLQLGLALAGCPDLPGADGQDEGAGRKRGEEAGVIGPDAHGEAVPVGEPEGRSALAVGLDIGNAAVNGHWALGLGPAGQARVGGWRRYARRAPPSPDFMPEPSILRTRQEREAPPLSSHHSKGTGPRASALNGSQRRKASPCRRSFGRRG